MKIETRIHKWWIVDVVTGGRRLGSFPDQHFETHAQARRWVRGEKVRGHPINKYFGINDVVYKLSRMIEMFDEDIEVIE